MKRRPNSIIPEETNLDIHKNDYECVQCQAKHSFGPKLLSFRETPLCKACKMGLLLPTPTLLKSRWEHADSQKTVAELIKAWVDHDMSWPSIISELPGSDNISSPDLRYFSSGNVTEVYGGLLENADLSHSHFKNCLVYSGALRNTFMANGSFQSCEFRGVRFERTSLQGANLTGSTFSYCVFDKADLRNVRFDRDHDCRHDGTETVQFEPRWIGFGWGFIRQLGQLPLFGISWLALATSLTTIITIGKLNSTKVLSILDYPIEYPERITLMLISSLFLVFGSSIYRYRCPKKIQEYSETEWVYTLNQPRLIYLRESAVNRGSQIFSAVGLFGGATLTLILIFERLVMALRYLTGH